MKKREHLGKFYTQLREKSYTSVEELYITLLPPELRERLASTSHHYDEKNKSPYHLEGSVEAHTLGVMAAVEQYFQEQNNLGSYIHRFFMTVAALHDIGKIHTRTLNHERKSAHFRGHEGVSFYMANDFGVPMAEAKLIATHGELYLKQHKAGPLPFCKEDNPLRNMPAKDSMVDGLDLRDHWWNVIKAFHKFDREGSIILNPYIPKEFTFEEVKMPSFDPFTPHTIVIVGAQNSGKSSLVKELCSADYEDAVLLSFDNLIQDHYQKGTYEENFNEMLRDSTFCPMGELTKKYNKLVKQSNTNVIVDMTNMSKKSRRRWVHESRVNVAYVFRAGFDQIMERNQKRKEKVIPGKAIIDTMCRFSYPMCTEGFSVVLDAI